MMKERVEKEKERSPRLSWDWDLVVLFAVACAVAYFSVRESLSAPRSKGVTRSARLIRPGEESMAPIFVPMGRSVVLSFPVKPMKVILGNKGVFAIEYVEQDLAIAALTPQASSNMFVYLEGRRFGFDLRTVSQGGDEIVLVRDERDLPPSAAEPLSKPSPVPKRKAKAMKKEKK